MGNEKVPAGLNALNIPLIIIKSKNNYIHMYLKSTLAKTIKILPKLLVDQGRK